MEICQIKIYRMRLLNFASVRYAILALITSVMGNQRNIVSCNKYSVKIYLDVRKKASRMDGFVDA